MSKIPTDIIEALYNVIKQCPDIANIKFVKSYPETGESLGLDKLPNEHILSQDMMGYIQKDIGYELTFKTQTNGVPLLRKVAVFLSDNIDKIQSSNNSFSLLTDPEISEPEMTGGDANYIYYSLDIALEIETNY